MENKINFMPSPETPKHRRKRRIITGLTAAGAAAAAIGAYVASHGEAGNEPLPQAEGGTEENAVQNDKPIESPRLETKAGVVLAIEEKKREEPDSGPTNEEIKASLLKDVARAIEEELPDFDQELANAFFEIMHVLDKSPREGDFIRFRRIRDIMDAKRIFWLEYNDSNLILRRGRAGRVAEIGVDSQAGTAHITLPYEIDGREHDYGVFLSSIEPWRVPYFLRDYVALLESYDDAVSNRVFYDRLPVDRSVPPDRFINDLDCLIKHYSGS